MISSLIIAAGIVVLAVSLAARYNDVWAVAAPASWLGALLVIIGVGKLLFLDD